MKDPTPSVDELAILGKEEDSIFKQFLVSYDVPAFIRRARQTEAAWEDLLNRCRRQREEWLVLVRQRLGALQVMAGDLSRLLPWLRNEAQLAVLVSLIETLKPAPSRCAVFTSFSRPLRGALRELVESLERFNRKWSEFLGTLDLGTVNEQRDAYNRYYVLEKECAVRSPRLARQGFQPLPPVTSEEVRDLFPPLDVPELRR